VNRLRTGQNLLNNVLIIIHLESVSTFPSYIVFSDGLFVIFCSDFSVDASACPGMLVDAHTEDPSCVKAAVFYSITSTQKGLQVCEVIHIFIFAICRNLGQIQKFCKIF
jgi:hypothetical protein